MTTPDEKLSADLPSTAQQFSPSETEPEKNKTDWRSIYVASFLALCAGVQCSLYYSSLWPYLQVIDKTATEKFYGTVIAFYSVGQIIGSPLVGYWSNRCKNISTPAIYGLCLAFAGNLLYLLVELVPTNRKYCILFARFIIGLGSSNITLLRVYASTASVPKDRSRAIAMTVGGSALGMTVGPLLQLIVSPMSYPGWRLFVGLSLNIYSTPALMACGMDSVAMLAVKFLFKEHYAGIVKKPKNSSGESVQSLPKCDYVAVALVHIARFAQVSVATTLELLNTPIGMTMFAFSKAEVVRYVSLSHSLRSLLAFSIFVFYAVVKVEERFKRLDFRINCLASLTGLIGFFLLTFSWPFIPGHIQTFSSNSTSSNESSVGCDTSKFSWCDDLSPVSPYVYYACYILVIGFFFPNLNIALTTLFSRILGPRRQGTQQGLMQMSSSSARLVGPLLVSTVYTEFGPRAAWMLPIAVTSLSIALWITCYQRLAPLPSTQLYLLLRHVVKHTMLTPLSTYAFGTAIMSVLAFSMTFRAGKKKKPAAGMQAAAPAVGGGRCRCSQKGREEGRCEERREEGERLGRWHKKPDDAKEKPQEGKPDEKKADGEKKEKTADKEKKEEDGGGNYEDVAIGDQA